VRAVICSRHNSDLDVETLPLHFAVKKVHIFDVDGRICFAANKLHWDGQVVERLYKRSCDDGNDGSIKSDDGDDGDFAARRCLSCEVVGEVAEPVIDVAWGARVVEHEKEKSEESAASDDRLRREGEIEGPREGYVAGDCCWGYHDEAGNTARVPLRKLKGEIGAERVSEQGEGVEAHFVRPGAEGGEIPVEGVLWGVASKGRAGGASPAQQVNGVNAVAHGDQVVQVAEEKRCRHAVTVQEDDGRALVAALLWRGLRLMVTWNNKVTAGLARSSSSWGGY
jgi:hypothetical protein